MALSKLRNLLDLLFTAISPRATGIVWAGPIFDPSGYGSVSRNFLLGLAQLLVPLRAVNLGGDHSALYPPRVTTTIRNLMEGDPGFRPVLIVHHLPENFAHIPENFAGRRSTKGPAARIGCTIFETDRIPAHWVGPCNQMDEVWVPSEFNRETFSKSGVAREKLRVIPYSVDTDYFHPITERYDIPGVRRFCFLYTSFWDWRKGFDLLIEAYLREFTDRDDTTLLIRTNDPDPKAPKSTRELRQLLLSSIDPSVELIRKDLPHFEIVTERLSQDDLRRLYNTCDLYISTDRANGWGMPCMEAMAMGKPAATINWSGSTQFMTASNSLLIHPTGRLVPVDPRLAAARPLYAGHQWAEVSVAEVRRVMRFAFENREAIQQTANQGMKDVRSRYSLAATAARAYRAARSVKLQAGARKVWRVAKERLHSTVPKV